MVDFLLTEDAELAMSNGDVVLGESRGQVAYLILQSARGSWRRYPFIGVDIQKHLNSPDSDTSTLLQDCQTQLVDLEGLPLDITLSAKGVAIAWQT